MAETSIPTMPCPSCRGVNDPSWWCPDCHGTGRVTPHPLTPDQVAALPDGARVVRQLRSPISGRPIGDPDLLRVDSWLRERIEIEFTIYPPAPFYWLAEDAADG